MSESPRRKCSDCGGRLERLIGSGGGVILKGSGFYTTDYRSETYHRAARKEKEAAGKADKADAASSSGSGKSSASGSDSGSSSGADEGSSPGSSSSRTGSSQTGKRKRRTSS